MWQCFIDIVDLFLKVAQTGIAGFGAWLAWRAFLKEDAQESDDIDLSQPAIGNISYLKIFETSNQTTILKNTASGLECHLNDRRPGKRQGNRWTLSPATVDEILKSGDIYVNSGMNFRSGLLSIGSHTNWLYFKNLFPEPSLLHHRIVELLRSVNA
ncbi:hypothetical protein [Oceanobacter sp. 3_MG-2023]|uniref:hypothetical protein n=1 Tax=Oceanobacter sp. 3_MG-2023 TaxID=3062622 RepID=UPI0027347104|nr:hypothetical protein [Oceanobacter sp. 3_MG-2023]MDP2506854.1 hypothetical protein [Oceanobacter sp. 3_MG-2023]